GAGGVSVGGRDGEPGYGVVAIGDSGVIQGLPAAADGDGLGDGSGPAQGLRKAEIGGTQGQRSGSYIERDRNFDGAVGDGRASRPGGGYGDCASVGTGREPSGNYRDGEHVIVAGGAALRGNEQPGDWAVAVEGHAVGQHVGAGAGETNGLRRRGLRAHSGREYGRIRRREHKLRASRNE